MTPRSWSLDGTWQIRAAGSNESWRDISVPGAWEDGGLPMDRPGPYAYRRSLDIPVEADGHRLWLRFGAVSYACRVLIDGVEVGIHVGAWDAFEVEMTRHVQVGSSCELVVEVEKPASLTAGPDSETVPGRFPLRQTLSGFLPYVWGHLFGGIWQGVSLVATGGVVVQDAHVRCDDQGTVHISVRLSAPAVLETSIQDPDGRLVASLSAEAAAEHELSVMLPDPRPWSPRDPALYACGIRVADGDEKLVPFGLRRISVEGTVIQLNGAPIYPRLILSWGWYPDRLAPTPDADQVRADLLTLRELGFNGIKLCLWHPPDAYLRIADELGMLVWLELPMWLPRPGPGYAAQVAWEYEQLVRQARQHPSVIIITLGCELDMTVADYFLGPLYGLVKHLAGDTLVRDNSGSGEAYGGALDEHADFDDHHLYADLPYLPGLVDHFAPRWRAPRPWLFGEFADSDAFRDPRWLGGEDGSLPWWAREDAASNPQGARWTMDVTRLPDALDRAGVTDQGQELRRISEVASLLHRQQTLELVRGVPEVSGYVVTGERDTPISTAGVWDDTGRVRFLVGLRASNDDLVVLIRWGRRRAWIAGGDRPAPLDPWSHRSGDPVRASLLLSHYGRSSGRPTVRWSARWATHQGAAPAFASGTEAHARELSPGTLRELASPRFRAPDVAAPRAIVLRAAVRVGDEAAANEWPMWVFPSDPWKELERVGIVDPARRLADLVGELGDRVVPLDEASVAVVTRWTSDIDALVDRGVGVVLLQPDRDGPLPAEPLPFWREGIRVAAPHPAWGDFPTEPFIGLQLRAASADHAFDTATWAGRQPILWRLDARTGRVHDYAVELPWGKGRLIASSLRLDGRSGDLPVGMTRSAASCHLLACWLRHVKAMRR